MSGIKQGINEKGEQILTTSKYVGVDIGGTNIACGISDERGTLLHKASIKTGAEQGYAALIKKIAQLVNDILTETGTGMSEVARIGVGCPGCCNKATGIVELCVNLGWRDVPLVKDLSNALNSVDDTARGVSITIENDANAAAYGEFIAGAARGADSAVVITLGTGVGSGIIINGNLLRGTNFAGGELGHMVIQVDSHEQELCGCGRTGCFESYSSATGLIRMTHAAMAANPDSEMHRISEEYGKISARTAWQAARRGDSAGQEVVDRYVRYLAAGITNVINIFQPDIVCLGGGVCNEGENLLRPLTKLISEQVYSRESSDKNSKIAICELGNDAGIIGAALCG
jgi:glucokinase